MYYCRKYCLMVGCLLILCSVIRAQDTLTSAEVESRSSIFFTQGNWDALIRYGNTALSKGFDYYYLRYRLGVAYFSEKKYRQAQNHFEKAITFNSTDEAMEYLYYCYLYTGQYERARWLSKSFSSAAVSYTGSDKLKSFSYATLEAGVGTTDSTKQFDNYYYMQAGAGFYVKNRFSMYHALTYFTQTDFRGITNQLQYYLNGKVPLKNDWSIAIGAQPILRDYSATTYPIAPTLIRIPSRLHPPPNLDSSRFVPKEDTVHGPVKTKLDFVSAVSITKTTGNFDFTLGTAIGSLDTTTQYEQYIGISWYPMGNNIFSINEIAYLHTETYYQHIHFALNSSITFAPTQKFSLTASYLANTGGNLVESNGYIVSGTPDFMLTRFSLLADIAVSKSISIYGAYQHQDNIEFHQHWPFQYNLYVIGLKYIPK